MDGQTPERSEIGAIGGSDPSTNKSRTFKLRASRLARSRESSADSAKDSHVELIDRTATAISTDCAASNSISQQPEPSAPPGDLTDQLSHQQLAQQLGSQTGQQSADQQTLLSQAQVAYNPQNPQPVDQGVTQCLSTHKSNR